MLQSSHKTSSQASQSVNYFSISLLSIIPTHHLQRTREESQPHLQTASTISYQSSLSFPIPSQIIRNLSPSSCNQALRYNQLEQENITNPMRCTFNQTQKASFWLEDSHEESIFQNITRQPSRRAHKFKWNNRIIANINPWNYSQRIIYIEFLRQFFGFFELSCQQKRKYAIYARMAEFITSRNYAQCRIRHGSMIKRYKTIQNIIKQQERRLRHAEPLLEMEDDGNRDVTQIVSIEVDFKGEEERVIWTLVEEDCWSHQQIEES